MIPKLIIGQAIVYAGNNLEVLPEIASNSVDSIVCDPPYELGFMGKSWDNSGIAYSVELWKQCLRVLKPGGHLLAFGGTRTWHRLAVAIEDAGFEIRDNIAWLYGSGFPKSLNVAKSIEAKLTTGSANKTAFKKLAGEQVQRGNWGMNSSGMVQNYRPNNYDETAGETRLGKLEATTDEAKQWDGWGTALKPAHEPIVVARKPVIGTVAENVLKYGTGAINIDATRIDYRDDVDGGDWNRFAGHQSSKTIRARLDGNNGAKLEGRVDNGKQAGRWPANIILDEYTAELLDEQTATLKGAETYVRKTDATGLTNINFPKTIGTLETAYGDSGGASRFFYVAKASKRDRNEGLDELPVKQVAFGGHGNNETDGMTKQLVHAPRQNFHPTVKPTTLMQYLIKLVTPVGGTVLDPFTGSGSTGKAAILNGNKFIGIELTAEYLPIIEGRLKHAYQTLDDKEADLFE